MNAYSWDWKENGVAIFHNGVKIGELATDHPSRDGLAIVDALQNANTPSPAVREYAASEGINLDATTATRAFQ